MYRANCCITAEGRHFGRIEPLRCRLGYVSSRAGVTLNATGFVCGPRRSLGGKLRSRLLMLVDNRQTSRMTSSSGDGYKRVKRTLIRLRGDLAFCIRGVFYFKNAFESDARPLSCYIVQEEFQQRPFLWYLMSHASSHEADIVKLTQANICKRHVKVDFKPKLKLYRRQCAEICPKYRISGFRM